MYSVLLHIPIRKNTFAYDVVELNLNKWLDIKYHYHQSWKLWGIKKRKCCNKLLIFDLVDVSLAE